MTRETKNLIVGLDIGTSKIVTVVAEILADGRLEVIGLGQADCEGLKRVSWSTSTQQSSRFRNHSKMPN